MRHDRQNPPNQSMPGATHRSGLRKTVRHILDIANLNVRRALVPGVGLVGLNLFRDARHGPRKYRGVYALEYALSLKPSRVLDVGSGGGYHARAFQESGCEVLCIDHGDSSHARTSPVADVAVLHMDFFAFTPTQAFDLVWVSHVLEHQRNVGNFIEKVIACCRPEGYVCITVPDPHRLLSSGHLAIWSPGLLAYNIVLCGIDLSSARFIRGTDEFSIIFQPRPVTLPPGLTFDDGDLEILAPYMPQNLSVRSDPWRVSYTHL